MHVPTQLTQKQFSHNSELCVIEFCHFSSTLSCVVFDMAATIVGATRAALLLLLSSVIAQERHPVTIIPGHGAN